MNRPTPPQEPMPRQVSGKPPKKPRKHRKPFFPDFFNKRKVDRLELLLMRERKTVENLEYRLRNIENKKCFWKDVSFTTPNLPPKKNYIPRFKSGCTGASHGTFFDYCPDCGGKPVVKKK